MLDLIDHQSNNIYLMADGTHKIGSANKVLISIGCISICQNHHARKEMNDHVHSFRPLMFAYTDSENGAQFAAALEHLKECPRKYLNLLELSAEIGLIDHSNALANGYKQVFPDIKIVECFPHVMRNIRKYESNKVLFNSFSITTAHNKYDAKHDIE